MRASAAPRSSKRRFSRAASLMTRSRNLASAKEPVRLPFSGSCSVAGQPVGRCAWELRTRRGLSRPCGDRPLRTVQAALLQPTFLTSLSCHWQSHALCAGCAKLRFSLKGMYCQANAKYILFLVGKVNAKAANINFLMLYLQEFYLVVVLVRVIAGVARIGGCARAAFGASDPAARAVIQ